METRKKNDVVFGLAGAWEKEYESIYESWNTDEEFGFFKKNEKWM